MKTCVSSVNLLLTILVCKTDKKLQVKTIINANESVIAASAYLPTAQY